MVPTPHIEAQKGDIAETVLMPGDPLRAKFIAENFLQNVKEYNKVRGMLGFTGEYKGKKISVQGSGMGIPSMGIYSYELYNFYDVKNIIRIGSAGSLREDLKINDIVLAIGSSTDSNYSSQYNINGHFSATASYNLLELSIKEIKKKNINYKVGNVLCTEVFYKEDEESLKKWQKIGIMAVEMESFALYTNAAVANKNAICILTISDTIFSKEMLSSKERENSFINMMEISLETAISI